MASDTLGPQSPAEAEHLARVTLSYGGELGFYPKRSNGD